MQVTVIGASGGIGGAVARALHERGHETVAVSRRGDAEVPDDVRRVAVDAGDRAALRPVLAGSDVVVMAAQPPYPRWLDEFPPLLDAVVAATAAAGARLVFVDNLYMYAPADGPVSERSAEHATDPKGALRRRLGERLRAAHGRGDLAVAIGRFSDYYGPGGTNSALYVLGIGPGLRGRTMRGLVDLDQPHTYAYLPDAGHMFATLAEHPAADGRTWVLPAAPAITQRDLLGLVGAHLPRPVRVAALAPWMLRLGGLADPMARETRSVVVQYDRPWVVDGSAFVHAFGAPQLTPHDRAVADTMAWSHDGAAVAR